MKRIVGLSRASFLELVRDPVVSLLSLFFPLVFVGMYFVLPDLTLDGGERVSALTYGLPAIILLGALALGLSGTAAPMSQHRKDGVLRSLGMTPVTPGAYLLAQLPARMLVVVAETALIVLIAAATGTLHLRDGSLFLLAVGTCIATTLSLGLLLGARSANPTLVGAVGGMLIPAILFSCGVFLPFRMMPPAIETFARFLPFTYVGDMLRHSLTGVTLAYSPLLGAGVCVAWTLLAGFLAVRIFRWSAR